MSEVLTLGKMAGIIPGIIDVIDTITRILLAVINQIASVWSSINPLDYMKSCIEMLARVIEVSMPLVQEIIPLMPLCWILAGATLMTTELPLFCIIPPPLNIVVLLVVEIFTGIVGVVLPLLLMVLMTLARSISP